MKLATRTNEFHSNLVKKSVGYKVANSATAMEVLSSMYADPLFATIRELSTNAKDSHTDANNSEPFDLHMPSSDEPYFSIRDYGTGLSEKKLEELYTVYFRSDKGDSNEVTGCLGLGSKSPFSYTDTFTTVSYYNGMKYVAINALNERGRPTFNIMIEDETDEPNGLEISFEVKYDDHSDCNEKAVKVFQWFDSVPNCNLSDFEDKVQEAKKEWSDILAFSGSDWKVFNSGYYNRQGSMAIMGSIAYEIDSSHFTGNVAKLISNGVHINVNIGDLDIAPSRDNLKYTKHTISELTNRVQNIIDTIKTKLEQEIQDIEYKWDARVKAYELTSGNLRRIHEIVATTLQYKGEDINTDYRMKGIDNDKFVKFSKNTYKNCISKRHGESILVGENTKFVVSDLSNKGHAALRRHIDANPKSMYYLFDNVDEQTHKDGLKYITEKIGVNPADILLTSSFPAADGIHSSKRKGKGGTQLPDTHIACQELQKSRWGWANKNYWNTTTVEIDSGTHYYVVIDKKYDVETSGHNVSASQLINILGYAGSSLDDTPVIGLTQKRYEKIKNKVNWKEFKVFCKKTLDKWYSVPDNVKSLVMSQSLSCYNSYKNLKDYIEPTTSLFLFLQKFENLPDVTETQKISSLLSNYEDIFGVQYKLPGSTIKFNSEYIEKKYPLLPLLDEDKIRDRFYNKPQQSDLQTVASYINSIG